jgi:hypothetical protein
MRTGPPPAPTADVLERGEGYVEIPVERARYRTSSIREDIGAGNVHVCRTCSGSDEREDIREGAVGCGEIIRRTSENKRTGRRRTCWYRHGRANQDPSLPRRWRVGSNACNRSSRSYPVHFQERRLQAVTPRRSCFRYTFTSKVSKTSVPLSLKFWSLSSGTSQYWTLEPPGRIVNRGIVAIVDHVGRYKHPLRERVSIRISSKVV